MKTKQFQKARDFAGADWQNMKPESRKLLLKGYRLPTHYHGFTWWQLPPTVQKELAMTVVHKKAVMA